MRSGHFKDGEQVGEWTTYDAGGAVYKVTEMKAGKPSKKAASKKAKSTKAASKKVGGRGR